MNCYLKYFFLCSHLYKKMVFIVTRKRYSEIMFIVLAVSSYLSYLNALIDKARTNKCLTFVRRPFSTIYLITKTSIVKTEFFSVSVTINLAVNWNLNQWMHILPIYILTVTFSTRWNNKKKSVLFKHLKIMHFIVEHMNILCVLHNVFF